MSIEEYADLYATGHESKEPIAPEDEFFHSVYIAGTQRTNHINIVEEIGKLQVRGVEYNKDSIHIIITHTKQILAKITRSPTTQRDTVECFCYQEGGPPWKGTSGRACGVNSAERAADSFCNICRAQMIVSGIYCDEKGKPFLTEDNKPTFVFLRGKGMKYSGVAEYLNEMSRKEGLEPIFTPETEETKKFEKAVVNNKRFVTEVTITEAKSQFGMKKVFQLLPGAQLPNKTVMDILKIAKQTVDSFNEKMDWSRNLNVSSYAQAASAPEGSQIPDAATQENANNEEKKEAPATQSEPSEPFNFEDLSF